MTKKIPNEKIDKHPQIFENKGEVIDVAVINAPGDPSVGIWSQTIRIEGLWFDLTTFAIENRKNEAENLRKILKEAFDQIMDDVSVFLVGYDKDVDE